MPDTVVGLVLFVVLLVPGLAYVAARELKAPSRTLSAFRETAAVVVASLLFNALAILVFALVRLAAPDHSPDLGGLVRDTGGYFKANYQSVSTWAVALLAGAACLAALCGAKAPSWAKRFKGEVAFRSAWWLLLHDEVPEGHTAIAGCELDDGSYLSGEVLSYSTEIEETENREIVLRPPVLYRPPGAQSADEAVSLDVSAVTVSARRIKFLTITYIPRAAESPGTAALGDRP